MTLGTDELDGSVTLGTDELDGTATLAELEEREPSGGATERDGMSEVETAAGSVTSRTRREDRTGQDRTGWDRSQMNGACT